MIVESFTADEIQPTMQTETIGRLLSDQTSIADDTKQAQLPRHHNHHHFQQSPHQSPKYVHHKHLNQSRMRTISGFSELSEGSLADCADDDAACRKILDEEVNLGHDEEEEDDDDGDGVDDDDDDDDDDSSFAISSCSSDLYSA
jgi:hypothetical protein